MTSRTIKIGAGLGAIAALAAPLTAVAATGGSPTKTPAPTSTKAAPAAPAATKSTTAKATAAHHFRVRASDGSRVDGLLWVRFATTKGRLVVRVKVHGLVPGTTHAVTIDRDGTVLYRVKSITADANGRASSMTDLTKVATWGGKDRTLRIYNTSSASSAAIATAHA